MTTSKQSQDDSAVIKNLHETYQCRMYGGKLLMIGKYDAPKHVEFYNRINLDN